MIFNSQNYPKTAEYLGIGIRPKGESQLDSDIQTITGILPYLVSISDEDSAMTPMCIEISYIIRNLQRVNEELNTKGGAQ